MSDRDFIPHRDAQFNDWSYAFAHTLSDHYAAYGETQQQAAAYAALDAVWREAYTRSIAPATRGPSATAAKTSARAAVQALARQITRRVQGTPAVTGEMKINLGVRVYKHHATPNTPPTTPPMMKILNTLGRTVTVKFVSDTVDTRRGRERGTAGVSVFVHRGPTPPDTLAKWTFWGNATRNTMTISFEDSHDAGRVWFTSRWYAPNAAPGPLMLPVSLNLPEGYSSPDMHRGHAQAA